MIIVHGEMEIDSAKMARVEADGATFAARCREEDGCVDYQLAWKFGEPTTLRLLEVWATKAAYETHVGQPHVKEWSAWIPSAAAGPLSTRRHVVAPVGTD